MHAEGPGLCSLCDGQNIESQKLSARSVTHAGSIPIPTCDNCADDNANAAESEEDWRIALPCSVNLFSI